MGKCGILLRGSLHNMLKKERKELMK